MSDEAKLREIKQRHSARLLAMPGVSGVGIEKDTQGKLVLAVHMDAAIPQTTADTIPDQLEGWAVKKVRSGPFRAF
jgi:hypothetical protein